MLFSIKSVLFEAQPVSLHLNKIFLQGELDGKPGGRVTFIGRIVPDENVGNAFSVRIRIVRTEMREGMRRVVEVYASVSIDGEQKRSFTLTAEDTNVDPYLDITFVMYSKNGEPIYAEAKKFRLLDFFEP